MQALFPLHLPPLPVSLSPFSHIHELGAGSSLIGRAGDTEFGLEIGFGFGSIRGVGFGLGFVSVRGLDRGPRGWRWFWSEVWV
ncbi:hypothetical protein TIFTF001_033871 [Ficus carica]|uniref:Uncharacterized protein n=1 Tax=Ficus carica TaxID=3494 RepID=A0AA88J8F0_FICCA|nr:hypothetical protein TIFTF001_033871 [Ficus carica]